MQLGMLWVVVALSASPVLASAPAPAYRVIDLTPTFWRYWDEAQGKPEPEQARLFRERVVAAHPDVYTPRVLGLDEDEPLDDELRERWPLFLGFVGPQLPLARRLSTEIGKELPRFDATFRRTFPDFAYDGEVYFTVSLGAFDGGTRPVKGRTALLFGVDVMARVYGEDADPASFFHHELFHLYHEQFPDSALSGTLGRAVWREGLAVYVAERLNPGTPEAVLFGLPQDMPERVRARLPALAQRLRKNLDSRERGELLLFTSGQSKDAEVPERAGYYLGYLVAKELAQGRSLRELAQLRGPKLRAEMDRALARLAKPKR